MGQERPAIELVPPWWAAAAPGEVSKRAAGVTGRRGVRLLVVQVTPELGELAC